MFIFRYICALSIFFLLSPTTIAQTPHYDFDSLLQQNTSFQLMAQQVFDTFQIFGPEEPLELTVSTDFRTLTKNKYQDQYQPATVIYNLWDSINISREIRIKPRGVLRLKVCSQPPLWVNVKKTKEVFQLLDDLGKLKLVVPCRGTSAYQQYIYSEYLIYKLYNIITDNSFRARMIRVNYSDTSGKLKPGHSFTFIIESHESLANRQQSMPIKIENLSRKLIDQETAAILYLFQFMVGNTDWSISGLHNIKLIKVLDPSVPRPIAVPYDFDYAGLVNTNYAIPGEHVDIDRVTQRAYMGNCLPDALMEETFDLYIAKEADIMKLVQEFTYLNKANRVSTIKYLQEFYEIIKDPKRREFWISNNCVSY